ncbi:hypothetical protein GGH93_006131 [Coemansia aciculifera]|nr:hypothetical protein GGH93_006131 [Coemansia aciculifera]
MSNIELTSERSIYDGEDWSVAGLANERIIATGIFFYDVANIAPSSLRFREALCSWDFEAKQLDIDSVLKAYGIEQSQLEEETPLSQELGSVGIKDGRCLVFPNILQYKLPELELGDKTKPGHCKMLTFYFVDPSTRIPSTELVPPQQQDWCFEEILTSQPFRSMPQLIVEGIMAKIDYPISLKEAKKLRLLVYQDKSSEHISYELFAPHFYFPTTDDQVANFAPYHNSGTLKELSIRPVTEADWLVILYNGKETPAVFDSLTSLVLKFTDPSRTSTWTAIKDVEPFPVLSTLKVNGGYPFNDDLLFRGNGAMMQHLRLPFCAIAINALGRFGVLKRGSVTRMNSIRIGVATNIDKAHLARRADKLIEYQVHCMLEVALALHLSNDATDKPVYGAVKAAPSTAILHNLELGSLPFSTARMTSIISRLPSLVSFTCKIGGLGASIESIPASDCLSTLRAKHYPLSSNFRKLCVPYTANVLADQIAEAAMLIAVLCPNFVHVDISPKLRDEFSREIAWVSCNRSFQPYAESLRRLIYMDPDY